MKKTKVSRRNFIKGSAVASSTLMLSPRLMAQSVAGTDQNLVLLFMRGGHDALSAVAPQTSRFNMNQVRPDISYTFPNNASDSFYGINSQLTKLISLYNSGDLAIIHGVGGKHPSTSHFEQMDLIESGSSKKILPEGFLARFTKELDADAYSIEKRVPRSLRSKDKFVLQFSDRSSLTAIKKRPGQKMSIDRSNFLTSFFKGATIGIVGTKAVTLEEKQEDVNRNLAGVNSSLTYKNSDIKLLAEMLKASNSGVYTLSNSSWDHHRNLKDVFVTKANDLFDDLAKLRQDLGAAKWNKTTIVVMSEFGRRIKQNGSLGVDHGRGGVAYILGGKVNGKKIYRKLSASVNADNNLLNKLNQAKTDPMTNIDVTTDVRMLFAEIFDKVYGIKNATKLNSIFSKNEGVITDPIPNVASDRFNFIKVA